MGALGSLKHAWNVFLTPQQTNDPLRMSGYGMSYGSRPDRTRMSITNERSIISSIITRLAIDVASNSIVHVKIDENGRFLEEINSGLNYCLTVEANTDQAASHFKQDMVSSLCQNGTIAIVPVETTLDPTVSSSFEIKTLRVGLIVDWMPQHVRVDLYNEKTGRREQLVLPKSQVAIVENPLYDLMNEPNSTLQRLIQKLNLLDVIDNQSGSGKLDLIIQLPYTIKTETKRLQAEQRRADIEMQLKDSKYGIAYTDGSEKVTQLNRPTENNLMKQVEYLLEMLYSQLGMTKAVMDGTADEAAMLNYNARTVEPFIRAIVEALIRSFLTKTARTQGQSILYFSDPFKYVPISQIAEIIDKFSRNEILTSNESRGLIKFRPSKEKKADELQNSNMPAPSEPKVIPPTPLEGDSQNGT